MTGTSLITKSTTKRGLTAANGLLILMFGGFLSLGLLDGASGVLWTDILDEFGISKSAFGLVSGLGLGIAFPILLFGGKLAERHDRRALIGLSLFGMGFASLGLVAGMGGIAIFALCMVIRASGITMLDMATNALAMDYERETRRHIMGPLHSGFSGGTLLGAAVVWAAFAVGGGFKSVYLGLTMVSFGLMIWAFILSRTPMVASPVRGSIKASAAIALLRRSDIRWLGLITAFTMGGEILISQWVSIYLREEEGFSARVGVYAVAAYGFAMFTGRVTNGPVAARLGNRSAILVQGSLAMVGGALIVSGGPAAVAVLGCGIAGYGLAGTIPIAMSLVGRAVPHGTAAASGATLALGYLGLSITPIIAGGVADLVSARAVMAGLILAGGLIVFMASRFPASLRGGIVSEA